ncbi:DUF1559 domain-containing protein [Stieleria sp.]|uniref:DUF1559 domain-containing protein n=1 Tax=Stieleria magnilauensis TaxID=2527963 RepID=A0ABX5XMK5_9BACT|nr:hypothetical protein TBK1r_00440 [Planctomycetes bacterium TBK1r]
MTRGLTLIELLVVIAILALLSGLAMSGIGSLRESARLVECTNKVRQISLAVQQHASSWNEFPTIRDSETNHVGDPWADLDPYLELSDQRRSLSLWLTKQTPVIYSCPSDPVDGSNYRFNHGSSITWTQSLTQYFQDAANGPVIFGNSVRPTDVMDGLSNTAVVSERLCGIGYRTKLRSILVGPSFRAFGTHHRTDHAIESEWMRLNWDSVVVSTFDTAGTNPSEYGYHRAVYNHTLTPNDPQSCTFSGGFSSEAQVGFVGASSTHRGLVVVGMLDGSTHTKTDSVDLSVWAALGDIDDRSVGPDWSR